MIVHNVKQGSPEWMKLRAGIPTASELDALVSPTGKVRTGDTPRTYVYRKIAERYSVANGLGLLNDNGSSFAMDQGSILEAEARPGLALELGLNIDPAAFVTTDDGLFGCSPDGLIRGTSIGVEIKCPQPVNHVRWLLGGVVPDEHLMQCHGGMFATGADEWVFYAYRRKFPNLIVRVKRDEKVIAAIAEVVARVTDEINEGYGRLLAHEVADLPEPAESHIF